MPASCQDLKEIGHVLSGFYTVKGDGVLQSVYCDFTKAANGTGMNICRTIKLTKVSERAREHIVA
jgi:hypothetical protein